MRRNERVEAQVTGTVRCRSWHSAMSLRQREPALLLAANVVDDFGERQELGTNF